MEFLLGGELEYTDINTIAHALSGRKDYNNKSKS